MTNREIIEQLENAINLIKQDGKDWLDDRDIPILETCIKSLTTFEQIRAEIKETYMNVTYQENKDRKATWGLRKALEIIDKYRK